MGGIVEQPLIVARMFLEQINTARNAEVDQAVLSVEAWLIYSRIYAKNI